MRVRSYLAKQRTKGAGGDAGANGNDDDVDDGGGTQYRDRAKERRELGEEEPAE